MTVYITMIKILIYNLCHVLGWPKGTFSWSDYLEYCQVEAAPETCFQEVIILSVIQFEDSLIFAAFVR